MNHLFIDRWLKPLFKKLYFVSIILCLIIASSNYMKAQENEIESNNLLFELGAGYPISLSEHRSYSDLFINLGYKFKLDRHFAGFSIAAQHRGAARSDFVLSPRIRWGKYLSSDYSLSLDLGVAVYSKKYKSFPGGSIGVNLDRTDKYGLHLRYDHFSNPNLNTERNLIVGLHLSGKKASNIGLPIVGGVTAIIGILYMLAASSN